MVATSAISSRLGGVAAGIAGSCIQAPPCASLFYESQHLRGPKRAAAQSIAMDNLTTGLLYHAESLSLKRINRIKNVGAQMAKEKHKQPPLQSVVQMTLSEKGPLIVTHRKRGFLY